MDYRQLGNTGIKVSSICLGTMTFGEQNTESEAHEQLDYAIDNGVNFIDTAEAYAVPGRAETQGLTEKYIGTWIKERGKRDDFILATKVTGPSPNMTYISPNLGFSRDRIFDAIEKSLRRLQTDYVDLYQLHWPERNANFFGKRGYVHDENDPWKDNFMEAIDTLNVLIKVGKIRSWGLSNETPWGIMRAKQVSDVQQNEASASIQNPYNLLNRIFEIGHAEISMRENMGLLAYSPLAFGRLTKKYQNNTDTDKDRINLFKHLSRYNNQKCIEATKKYYDLAQENNLSLAQMSLAFIQSRQFVTSTIIGATSMEQLKENIGSKDVQLSSEVLEKIELIHEENPNPAP